LEVDAGDRLRGLEADAGDRLRGFTGGGVLCSSLSEGRLASAASLASLNARSRAVFSS
jgi:hypothetical protein